MTTKNIFNKLILLVIMLCLFIVISCKSPNNPTTGGGGGRDILFSNKMLTDYTTSAEVMPKPTNYVDAKVDLSDTIPSAGISMVVSDSSEARKNTTITVDNSTLILSWSEINDLKNVKLCFYEVVFYNNNAYKITLEETNVTLVQFDNKFAIPSNHCTDYATGLNGTATVYKYFSFGNDSYALYRIQ